MLEKRPRPEQKKLIEVCGDVDLARRKLKAKLTIAFLLSKRDLKVYVSSDNSHLKAAKAAGSPSNNSKDILLKGRIVPMTSAFIFNEEGRNAEDFFKGDIDLKLIDSLVPEVALALKNWLGEEFENYSTSYKRHNFDRSPESVA